MIYAWRDVVDVEEKRAALHAGRAHRGRRRTEPGRDESERAGRWSCACNRRGLGEGADGSRATTKRTLGDDSWAGVIPSSCGALAAADDKRSGQRIASSVAARAGRSDGRTRAVEQRAGDGRIRPDRERVDFRWCTLYCATSVWARGVGEDAWRVRSNARVPAVLAAARVTLCARRNTSHDAYSAMVHSSERARPGLSKNIGCVRQHRACAGESNLGLGTPTRRADAASVVRAEAAGTWSAGASGATLEEGATRSAKSALDRPRPF